MSKHILSQSISLSPEQILANLLGKDIAGMVWSKYLNEYDRDIFSVACGHQPKILKYFSCYCAKNGYLDLLKWARSKGCTWDEYTCAAAAMGGHLETLKFLRMGEDKCPWDISICWHAARNGHINILQWAKINDCRWDNMTCAYVIKHKHSEVLQWLVDSGNCQCEGEYHK